RRRHLVGVHGPEGEGPMSGISRRTVRVPLVVLAISSMALAQTAAKTATESTVSKRSIKSGEIISAAGNKVLVKEADGIHEYVVPEGFQFQANGQSISAADLKPGMRVDAVINERTTVRDVTTVATVNGTVKQVAPGGIVVQDSKNNLKSYDFKDADGNDIKMVMDGKEVPLRDVKLGDRLAGTIVTKYAPQTITERSVSATVSEPVAVPASDTSGSTLAVATPPARRLPHTASPLPLIGLGAALAALTALTLRGARLRH